MRLALQNLPEADINMHGTLIVPPAVPLKPDQTIRERLDALDRDTQGDGMSKASNPSSRPAAGQPGTETERLSLRSLTASDEALYCSLYTDPQVMKHIYKPLTRAEAEQSFRKALESMQRTPFERRVVVISDKETGVAIGISGVHVCNATLKQAEVGTLLKSSAHAQRFGVELSNTLISQAFTRPQIDELIAHSTHGNAVVEALLKSLGFVRSGDVPAEGDIPARTRWTLTRAAWSKRAGHK
jgi:RimJ/RimL family protein N-acetyltransferase